MEAQGGGGGGEPDSAWVRTLTHAYYYYSGNEVSVVVEKADNGTILDWSHNVYAVGRKICSASRGDIISGTLTKNFIVADHQGNVRNVFNYDAQQNIVLNAAYWYNPFGKQDSVVVYGTGGHRFTYNDKELDDELGFEMYYYGARFYDPSIGRFSSPDPVKDYHNPYSYVRNNPIRYIDPTGMSGFPWGGGGKWATYGGIIGGGINVNMDDPMFTYNNLKNEGFNIFGFSDWMIFRGGGSSGANASKEGRNLTEGEKSLMWSWAFFAHLDYIESGGQRGISPEVFSMFTSMLDNNKIKIGQPTRKDASAEYNRTTGIMTINSNIWKDFSNPKRQAGIMAYVFHEVGHALPDPPAGTTEWHQTFTPPSGATDYYHYDRRGYRTQMSYWESVIHNRITVSGGRANFNAREDYREWKKDEWKFWQDRAILGF